ncbi:MAG: Ig-like domain-containing protein [Isosphaeraceae bacterium]
MLESLESRVVLYSATGNAWMNPEIITISFVPDGTNLGGVTSNLQSTFNSNPNLVNRWENTILQAAQVWAQQTNINFEVVPDDGEPTGAGADQEGDPNFGDIRIGGYNFGSGNSTLAYTTYPPSANNFSIAGDIDFNTGMPFNIGSTYDLFTVAAHEVGHALGLGESTVNSVMYPVYEGVRSGLASDDIAGIRSIYSAGLPRTTDAYLGLNLTELTAANLDSSINLSSLTALAYNLDIATAGQSEFFSVDVPSGTSGTFSVSAQSLGLSLLTPEITVYNSNLLLPTVLGSATGTGYSGSDPTVNLTGVTAGERLYIKVQGASTTAMGTGDYALGMSFNSAAVVPTEASPIIAYPNGSILQGGGGSPDQVQGNHDVDFDAAPTVTGISPDTGSSNADGITNVNQIVIKGIGASNETVMVYLNGTLLGTTTTNNNGNWSFDNTGTALADGNYSLTAATVDSQGNVSALSYPYAITIDTTAPAPPTILGLAGGTTVTGNSTTTDAADPILFGTSVPYSQVSLFYGTFQVGSVVADSNGNWDWTNTFATPSVGVTYTLTAQATDVAGNVSSPSATFSVTQVSPSGAAQSPTVSSASLSAGSILSTNADGSFNTIATPTINGAATANTEVAVFDDGVVIGVALVDSTGTWSFTCSTLSTVRQELTFEDINQLGTFSAVACPITIQS